MHPNNESRRVSSDLIDHVIETAGNIGLEHENRLLACVASMMMREAHLAIERTANMVQIGVPEETALFLAADDMGFQLAYSAAQAWQGK